MGHFFLLCAILVHIGVSTNSKLSIFSGGGSLSNSFVQNARPKLVKLLDNFGPAAQWKQESPETIIIGRIYQANQPETGDPKQAAQNWWNSVSSTVLANPSVDYWEGYNEPDPNNIAWLSEMEMERINILSSHGRKACIFNFATGTPDVTNANTIKQMYPAVKAAIAAGGILGLHEYGAPFMNATYSGASCDGSGWLCGRYRKLYNQYLLPNHLNISLAITENGIDCGTCDVTHCHCQGGWKGACSSEWSNQNCNQQYLNQLQWYDQMIRCDGYVLGSTIFTLEISGWDSFDISPIVPALTNYVKSQ